MMIRSSMLSISIIMLLFSLFFDTASAASEATLLPSTSTTEHLAWQGAWHFEPSWFAKQHPWLPKFVTRKALSSTLVLDSSGYHQLDETGKPLKQKRPLSLLNASPNKALLQRTEGKKTIEFHLERRQDNHVYYCEGESAYRLLRPDTYAGQEEEEAIEA